MLLDEKEYFKLAAYVKASRYRLKIIDFLSDGKYGMPLEIANKINIKQSHISKVLKELKEKELVECINPEVRKGKLYHLTVTGEETVPYIRRIS